MLHHLLHARALQRVRLQHLRHELLACLARLPPWWPLVAFGARGGAGSAGGAAQRGRVVKGVGVGEHREEGDATRPHIRRLALVHARALHGSAARLPACELTM